MLQAGTGQNAESSHSASDTLARSKCFDRSDMVAFYLSARATAESIGGEPMSNIDEVVGARARALRKAQKKALKDIAEKAELSTSYLSELERGERRWTAERLQQVGAALNVAPSLLQDQGVPLDRIHQIEEILEKLSEIPQDKLEAVTQLLEALRS